MRLDVMISTSIAKAVNKARLTGSFSLLAVAKLDLLIYYLNFTKDKEDYKNEHNILQKRVNKFIDNNRTLICNIREASCFNGTYEPSNTNVTNPYNPQVPGEVTPEPTPENLPPTIGDNAITAEENVTTVLTLNMFTVDTNLPYSDPEGDLIDAIRVDRLHSTNQGLFYLNGMLVTNGTVITREQILNEEFIHIGAEDTTVFSDGFEFSARDEGSGIWVN